jgi:hypothetical protein
MLKSQEKSDGTAGFHFRLVSFDISAPHSAQRKRILDFGQIGISIARKRWALPESERALPRPNAEFIG